MLEMKLKRCEIDASRKAFTKKGFKYIFNSNNKLLKKAIQSVTEALNTLVFEEVKFDTFLVKKDGRTSIHFTFRGYFSMISSQLDKIKTELGFDDYSISGLLNGQELILNWR